MNVGASAPEESGLYFSWGNNPGHEEGSGYDFSREVYDLTPAASISADLTIAEDMARQSIGAPWRLPSAVQYQELYDNCTRIWTELNGVHGMLFTSRVNGKTLFLPAAGYYNGTTLSNSGSSGDYWSLTYNSAENARSLYFNSSDIRPQNDSGRHYGFSVRAVKS